MGDCFSKWKEAFAVSDNTANTVADKLATEFITRFGIPNQIMIREENLKVNFHNSWVLKRLELISTETQSDGLVERFNRTLTAMLSTFVNDNKDD